MKLEFPEVKANFIVDAQGQKKSVILDMEQFQHLMDTLEDFYDIAQAALSRQENNDETITLDELEKQIKAHDEASTKKRG